MAVSHKWIKGYFNWCDICYYKAARFFAFTVWVYIYCYRQTLSIRVFYYVNIINSHQNYACQAIYLDDFYFCADPCGHETAANFVGIQYEHWTVPAHVLRLSGLC